MQFDKYNQLSQKVFQREQILQKPLAAQLRE